MTPPPTDRLRELFAGLDPKKYSMKPGTNEPWAYQMAPAKLWEEAKAEAESLRAQADRAERLEHALRLARPHLEFDCIDDEDQKVLEAARDTVDAALADAEGA